MSEIKNMDDLAQRLGVVSMPPDPRNYRVRAPTLQETTELPSEYEGLDDYTFILDQGDVGTCGGHSGAGAIMTTDLIMSGDLEVISAGWIYHHSRIKAHIPSHIEGTTNLGVMKALKAIGATTEICCPTDNEKPWDGIAPCANSKDPDSEHHPSKHAIDSYWMVNSFVNDLQAAIFGVTHPLPYKMPDGTLGKAPLIVAYDVHENFIEAREDGIVPPPAGRKRGGHSSLINGWKFIDDELYWKNPNSWGEDWGDEGYNYLPVKDFHFRDAWIIHNGPPVKKHQFFCWKW